MTTNSAPSADGGFLAPPPDVQPMDHCYRCGKPTPQGQSLCAECNPGRVKGPSTTQLHATLLVGVLLGGFALLVLWKFMVGQGGPYTATFTEKTIGPDGGAAIVVSVQNTGTTAGVANCRVTRDGAPRPDDPTYRTEKIAPGESATLQREVPAPAINTPAYDTEHMTVLCT
ncbi:MAG: hypothetical protein U0869_09900 [Chloroflexota bacterium]